MASLVWRDDRGCWYAYFQRDDGGRTGKVLRAVPRKKRLSKVERKAAELEAERVERLHRTTPFTAISLGEGINVYLAECKVGVAARTYQRYKGALIQFFDVIGDMPLRDVTPAEVRRFRDVRLRTMAGTTVRNDLKAVSALFAWWHRQRDEYGDRVVMDNPAEDVARPDADPKPKHFPSVVEVRRMLELLRGTVTGPRDMYALGLFGALAGMRRSDITQLKVDDIDLQGRMIYVMRGKSKRPRPIPMHPMIYDYLMDRELEGEYAFRSTYASRSGEKWSHYLGRQFNEWLRFNGFEFTHKNLRDFFNDALRRCPALPTSARLLIVGHEDEATNRVYSNPQASEARPFVDALLL